MTEGKELLESRSDPIPPQNGENPEAKALSSAIDDSSPAQPDVAAPETGVDPSDIDESFDADISEETERWVDGQISKWKTGVSILGRAKNNKRKDLAAIERYVEQLVAESKIPMSGKKTPSSNKKSATQPPLSNLKTASVGKPLQIVEVDISEIHMNAQIRKDDLNEANVLRIMESFDSTDPIDLFRRPEGELELANGYHRMEAAKRLGKKTIQSYTHEGTMCDALIFAYKTNDRNGIPLTKADRMNALIMIKKTPEGGKLTGEQLADQLGVSRQTIQTYLAEIRDGKQEGAKKRTLKDEAVLLKKAVATLARIEDRFGLTVFHDFVQSLDDDKRAELRAMLDGGVE